MPDPRPRFDREVARNGYLWWYVDALSDDGTQGVTLIAFIGSVFSPYYFRNRRRGLGDPTNHCALNAVVYGPGGGRWALTERGRRSLRRESSVLQIGPSALTWDGNDLVVRIDEVAAPLPRRIRGTVRVSPGALTDTRYDLDEPGRHRWWPIAPSCRVEVDLERPSSRWAGTGYFDTNEGDEPLEDGFAFWNWSRVASPGLTRIAYNLDRRAGGPLSLALEIDATGATRPFEAPAERALPTTRLWRMRRSIPADGPGDLGVERTLEDTPFYSRSVVSTKLLGTPSTAMHESLSLDRFRAPWVRMLLPFRMPRHTIEPVRKC